MEVKISKYKVKILARLETLRLPEFKKRKKLFVLTRWLLWQHSHSLIPYAFLQSFGAVCDDGERQEINGRKRGQIEVFSKIGISSRTFAIKVGRL